MLHFSQWNYVYYNNILNASLVYFFISVNPLLPQQKVFEN